MKSISELLDQAKLASIEAGKAILEVYGCENFSVEIKSDQSPLTQADKAANAVIFSHLEKAGIPILSEEGASIRFEDRKKWEYFWLVDPLDGTKEFIKRTGEFTFNIALMQAGIPIAGVIYAPFTDVLYFGSKETGAYKIEKNNEVQLSPVSKKASIEELRQKQDVTIVASTSHMSEETSAFINQFRNYSLRSMGSSLKLMLVAEGVADIYPRLAPTMEWILPPGMQF